MTVETLFALAACALVGIGLYGLIAQPHPLRKLVAFNVMGSGVFLVFGSLARRGAAAGMLADPVPQALLITAIVVAFAATALTVALLLRLIEATGSASLAAEPPASNGEQR
jgi:multicomponent Na+:H+ antiporter subunit C